MAEATALLDDDGSGEEGCPMGGATECCAWTRSSRFIGSPDGGGWLEVLRAWTSLSAEELGLSFAADLGRDQSQPLGSRREEVVETRYREKELDI